MSKKELVAYLDKKTNYIDGCWLYTGRKEQDGHCLIAVEGKRYGVHRLSAWAFLNLNLEDNNQQANHKTICSNAACWNPEHLYVGTQAQNIQDSVTNRTHRNASKDLCQKGHPFTTRLSDGTRYCKTCVAARKKLRKQKGMIKNV